MIVTGMRDLTVPWNLLPGMRSRAQSTHPVAHTVRNRLHMPVPPHSKMFDAIAGFPRTPAVR